MPDTTELIVQLNELLLSLHLPFILQSPTDLTPSLLLAILESILGVRIPLDDQQHHHHASSPESIKRTRQIQTIKIFLGVLETDVLKADVGLSRIDPRRLAEGAWDEVVAIAEILCWIGRETGLVRMRSEGKGKQRELSTSSLDSLDLTPQHSSTPSTITFLPSPFPENTNTLTSLLFTEAIPTTTPLNDGVHYSPQPTTTLSHHHPHATHHPPPVRKTGYISLVDHDSELSTFLSHSLSISSTSSSTTQLPTPTHHHSPQTPTTSSHPKSQQRERDILSLISESPEHDPRRTLQLLQDRTHLMEELLRLRMSKPH